MIGPRTSGSPRSSSWVGWRALGNLRHVTLPGGAVEYAVDGLRRRVGKKVSGVLAKGWLYAGALRPAAELDGAGAVTARFV